MLYIIRQSKPQSFEKKNKEHVFHCMIFLYEKDGVDRTNDLYLIDVTIQNPPSVMREQYIRQQKMIMIIFLSLLSLALSASDTLLSISRSSSCLKSLVADFVKADDCSLLSDQTKVKLSMKMTECLLLQMNKPFPQDCSDYSCKLQGDAWSTFTTFFAHIDNLCHFYWQTLRHERSQALISKLSQSSSQAYQTLRENTIQTQKILSMQHKLHYSIDQSLRSQAEMSALLNSSSRRLTNLTDQMEMFIESIHKELNDNYASLRNILEIINDGVSKVVEIQGYIRAQVTSVAGVVFFLCQFVCALFFTSKPGLETVRIKIVVVLVLEVLIELTFGALISAYLGITCYRYLFILLKLTQLFPTPTPDNSKQETPLDPFTTPRLKRAFRKAIKQDNSPWENSRQLSAIAAKVVHKLNTGGEGVKEVFV